MVSRIFAKIHPTWTPKPDDAKIWRRTWGGQGRDTDTWRDLRRYNPPGADMDLGAGREQQRGGENRHENGNRCRHTVQGAGTRGGGWRAEGTGGVQVGGDLHQDRRWGAGELIGIQRGMATEGDEVGKRGKRTIQKMVDEKGGAEWLY